MYIQFLHITLTFYLFAGANSEGLKHYLHAEHKSRIVLKYIGTGFFISITTSLFLPLLVVLFYYMSGEDITDKWDLPTVMM